MKIDVNFLKEVAEKSINALPEELKSRLDNIQVIVEDYPSLDFMKKLGITSKDKILGLYHGVPWGRRGRRYANVLPDVIVIYRKPIQKLCRSKNEVKQKIEDVVLHEIGHYFGFNDEKLKRMIE